MRVSQDEKDRSRSRIVTAAARLLRERGTAGASVADVMGEAGMTHGGFYRHFDTKEALLALALQAAFEGLQSDLDRRFEDGTPEAAVAGFHTCYLSGGHVDRPGIGCPVAAAGADIGRGPDALKRPFGEGVNRIVAALARGMKGSARARRARAMRELAMLAGAVIIARASDPDTAREVLAACRHAPGMA